MNIFELNDDTPEELIKFALNTSTVDDVVKLIGGEYEPVNDGLCPDYVVSLIVNETILSDERFQMAAIQNDQVYFHNIKNPTDDMKVKYVEKQGQYVKALKAIMDETRAKTSGLFKMRYWDFKKANSDPILSDDSEAVKVAIATHWPDGIKYIDNPSNDVKMAAITASCFNIKHIDNPTEEMQLKAVSKQKYALKHIKNPTEAVKRAAAATVM